MATSQWPWRGPTAPARSAGSLFFPLDEELQLLPGELTPLLHERLVQVGTVAKSFAGGATVFYSFTRTPASEPTARRYAERAGAVMEECEREDRAPDVPAPAEGTRRAEEANGAEEAEKAEKAEGAEKAEKAEGADRRPFWIGADGVMVRLVGGAWREVRTVTIGRVNPAVIVEGAERVSTSDLSYFSRLTESAARFIELAAGECARRGLASGDPIGAGSDGADWCQDLFDRYCPEAVRCLDFYHAGQRVHTFSKALWGSQPDLAKWYAGNQLHRLKHEGADRLLASLRAWSEAATEPKARKVAVEQHGFFSSRTRLLDYPGMRTRGLPIGTGNAESANLHVVQNRMKGPGKFWGPEQVNPMLALRNAWCSKRWDEAWMAASTHMAAGHYPVRLVHVPCAKN